MYVKRTNACEFAIWLKCIRFYGCKFLSRCTFTNFHNSLNHHQQRQMQCVCMCTHKLTIYTMHCTFFRLQFYLRWMLFNALNQSQLLDVCLRNGFALCEQYIFIYLSVFSFNEWRCRWCTATRTLYHTHARTHATYKYTLTFDCLLFTLFIALSIFLAHSFRLAISLLDSLGVFYHFYILPIYCIYSFSIYN